MGVNSLNNFHNKKSSKYIVGFLILFIILLVMIIKPTMANLFGEDILIKTEAYDPRDLFRGDYVRLQYEINEVDIELFEDNIINHIDDETYDYDYIRDKKLYVTLDKDTTYHHVKNVSLEKPTEGLYLIAEYDYPIKEDGKLVGIRLYYSLDKYFVPENTGSALEHKLRESNATARIRVYNGYALLKEIIIE